MLHLASVAKVVIMVSTLNIGFKMKKKAPGFNFLIFALGFMALMYFTNPTKQNLRDLMKMQNKLPTTIASYLPIERTDFKLFSRFDIKYGFGQKTCWGALKVVIICPSEPKDKSEPKGKVSDEANANDKPNL